MFQPLGVIFRLIKYGTVQGTAVLLPTGSRGLQYASYKIYSTWVMCIFGVLSAWADCLGDLALLVDGCLMSSRCT